MEPTSWKLLHRTFTMEEPHGTYIMEVTYWNLHHGSYLIEPTRWKLPHGTYKIEVTSWNLHH